MYSVDAPLSVPGVSLLFQIGLRYRATRLRRVLDLACPTPWQFEPFCTVWAKFVARIRFLLRLAARPGIVT
jgi:hypothetical protein